MTSSHKNIGHMTLRNRFQQMISDNTLPHATLITGSPDIGKYRLARHIAELMYQEHPREQRNIQHNVCSAVFTMGDLWQKGSHEQWEVIAKTSNFDQEHRTGKGGETPRRNDIIGIRDIQEFLKPLFQTSPLPYKIGIIRDIDRMSTEAQNAFLKTLEEPPVNTFFILTARHIHAVQETIVSRCQHVPLGLHPDEILYKYIQEHSPHFTEEEMLVMMAQGRSEYVFQCLEDSEFFLHQKENIQEISRLFFAPASQKLAKAHALAVPDAQEACLLFLENCTRFLRSILSEKAKGKHLNIAQKISYAEILSLQEAKTYLDAGWRANGNKKMLLENFFLSFP